jgi:hypothetical protein
VNTFSDERGHDHDELSAMLDDLPRVDPPPTLLGSVMSTIGHSMRHGTTQPANFRKRGSKMAKKVLWIVAAAAAVALVVMGVTGYPPLDKGTEATIGAAQRYQAQQISSADVKTGDTEMQAFLQSDLFHKLATDKAAREALRNPDFQRAIADAQVRAALAMPDVQAAVAMAMTGVATNVRLDAAQLVRAAAARLDAAPAAALNSAINASPALVQALAAPGVAQAIASSALSAALASPQAAFALTQNAVVNAVMMAAPGAALEAAPAASAGAIVQ